MSGLPRLPRADAENLADQICDALRPQLMRVLTDLFAEPEEGELSPRDLAKIARAALNMRRKMEGLPIDRRRKVG